MSRTSQALKRLGVAGVAVATIGAGIPAFFATAASANHTGANTATGVTLSPDADSAPTGTCNQFTATVTFSNNSDSATLDVIADPRAQNQDVDFCDLNTAGTQETVVADAGGDDPGVTEHREFTVTAPAGSNTGTVTFGIISNQQGVIDVTAFLEGTANTTGGAPNNTPNGNEPQETSVKTFTQGGAAGVAQNGLDATPESAVNTQGDQHEFSVVLTNSEGQPVPGVNLVRFDITSGPDANQVNQNAGDSPVVAGANANFVRQCTTTDQTGTATCRFTNAGGPGTDNITVFLDADNDLVVDTTEQQDLITKTFQAPQPAGTTVTLTCTSVRTTSAGDTCQNPVTEKSEVFTAVVRNAAGTAVQGVPVQFFFTKGGNIDDAGTTAAADNESLTPTTCTTDANGVCTTTLNNPRASEGEFFTVQARVGVSSNSGNCAAFGNAPASDDANCDNATKVFRTPDETEARVITIEPETQNAQVGSVATVIATVTDRFGNRVPGVRVDFSENGTGRFTNGQNTLTGLETDVNGQVRAELTTTNNEAPGSTTVTAFIFTQGNPGVDVECEQPASGNAAGFGAGQNQTAGDCEDTAVVNFTAAGQSPSATPTSPGGQPSTPPGCSTASNNLQVRINTPTINATGLASVTVTGATPGSTIELQGYSQNHFGTRNFANDPTPVDRTAVADSNGSATFSDLRPASNTRVRARQRGCAFGNIGAVINVRTQITLQVVRNGVRTYTFSGRTIPAREGGLIVSLYRGASEVLFRQTRATPGSDVQPQPAGAGLYSIRVTFPASEANTTQRFVVKTGQDAQNAPGRSNVRLLRVF